MAVGSEEVGRLAGSKQQAERCEQHSARGNHITDLKPPIPGLRGKTFRFSAWAGTTGGYMHFDLDDARLQQHQLYAVGLSACPACR